MRQNIRKLVLMEDSVSSKRVEEFFNRILEILSPSSDNKSFQVLFYEDETEAECLKVFGKVDHTHEYNTSSREIKFFNDRCVVKSDYDEITNNVLICLFLAIMSTINSHNLTKEKIENKELFIETIYFAKFVSRKTSLNNPETKSLLDQIKGKI